MDRRPPPEWELQFPAVRCPHCKKPIRGRFRGRFQFRALMGRGWRQQTGDTDPVPKVPDERTGSAASPP